MKTNAHIGGRLLAAGGVVALLALAAVVSACATSGDDVAGGRKGKVVLLAYDSFLPSEGIFDAFTAETGYEVEIVTGGDTGEMVNKAILTKNRPIADAIFGVDSSFVSRAVDAGIFAPHSAGGLDRIPAEYVIDGAPVTPVDRGDVCVNWDIAGLAARNVAAPTDLEDLADPRFDGLVVVQNPASSAPGLSFLLATVAEFGEDGWLGYWEKLRGNNVLVTDGWDDAYNVQFSGGAGKGPRPVVVSYATSPVAEVVFGDPRPDTPPTASMATGCHRSVEYAGVLANAREPEGAALLVDYLLSEPFQADLPLTLFVYPVNPSAPLPPEFAFAAQVDEPLTVAPDTIDANRDRWIDEWTRTVLR
jgi:thiamine transport system substrate-binding protein